MLSLCKSLLFFQTWKWCPSRYAGASHSVFGTEVLESPNSFKFSSSCWIMGGWLEIESLEAGKLEQHHKGWICFGSICPCRMSARHPPGWLHFLRRTPSREIFCAKKTAFHIQPNWTGVILWHQTQTRHFFWEEIPQNYPTFALFDPPHN